MQIVIDIPEEAYKLLKNEGVDWLGAEHILNAVANGTPLPKGHGDLKETGNLQYVFDLTREDPIYSGKDIERAMKSMTTIIKADTEENEETE